MLSILINGRTEENVAYFNGKFFPVTQDLLPITKSTILRRILQENSCFLLNVLIITTNC
jgi:hypothetical protein